MTKQPIPSTPSNRTKSSVTNKDTPLKEDIRLLGRLLGDVLRDQEGDTVFDMVETIRQTAVRFRRESNQQAGAALDKLLKNSPAIRPIPWSVPFRISRI